MNTIIVGGGEIGKSLYEVLSPHYETYLWDLDVNKCIGNLKAMQQTTNMIMHICFPYSDTFIDDVKSYKERFNPKYIVIHSTVPIGTSRKLGAVHSPVEGLHPFLKESIQTFTKFLSGFNADYVADYFRRANIKIYLVKDQESTELMKIMSTTFYGMQVEFTKEMRTLCEKWKVPFELFTIWNMNYNDSYEKLGHSEYKKPLLAPIMTNIKGHCIMQNTELMENDFTKFLKDRNNGKN